MFSIVLRTIGPTAHWSYIPLVLRPIGPTVIPIGPTVLPIGPTSHWSYSFFHWSYVPLVLHVLPIGFASHGSYLSLVLQLIDPNHIHTIHDISTFTKNLLLYYPRTYVRISGHTHEFNGLGSPALVENLLLPVPMMKPRM